MEAGASPQDVEAAVVSFLVVFWKIGISTKYVGCEKMEYGMDIE